MRRLPHLLPVLGAVLFLPACGGSETKQFTPADTRACLVDKGAKIGGRLDFIASTATGGAFRARLSENSVTVVFGQTEEDARQIESAYERAAAPNVGVADILARRLNVVLLWREHPSDTELEAIADCLD
jgi:hypothetical protein